MSVMHGQMQDYPLTVDKFIAHGAKWHGDAEVVTARGDGGVDRIGYATLHARSLCISALLARLGVQPGDIVATLSWNTRAHMEVWYAIMGMGAVCQTLNPRVGESHLAGMLERSGARLLVTSADLSAMAGAINTPGCAVEQVLSIDGVAEGTDIVALESLLDARDEPVAWGVFDEHAPCGLCFTSGTTGAPKGVTYTHRGVFLHTMRMLQVDGVALSARDRVLLAVPMFHANGWGVPFAAPSVGAALVLPGRHLDGASLAALINAESVTVAFGVATVWLALVEHLDATGGQTPSLQRIVVGGAAMAPALMQRLEQRLGVMVQTSWGMTELSPSGTFAPPGDPARAAHLSGRPAIGVDLLLTDETGQPLPEQRGVEGQLRVRGPSVVARYFGESSPALDADGWFATGDLARIDAHGNLTITGRTKDLIKSGGEWINPAEIEEIVGRLPEVSLAAVIGRRHPKWGERPLLLVEMREGCTLDEAALADALRGRVAAWWMPDAIIHLPQMPLASTGKVDKLRLRSEFGAAPGGAGA